MLLLIASPKTNTNARWRMIGLLLAPLIASTVIILLIFATRYADAADHVAIHVLTSFGLLFASEHLRLGGFVRGVGFIWWHIFGTWLLTYVWLTMQMGDFVRVPAGVNAYLLFVQLPFWTVTACCCPIRVQPASGKCVSCAYDLTGNVSGRCPECGATVGGVAAPTHARPAELPKE